jgi:heparin binding hemagglutinin HbhA
MTTNTKTRKIPAPLYAAAGAGDLAYQKLRKLPDQVSQLRGRVSELAPVVSDVVSETNLRADLDRLRHVARRNAATLVAGAQLATERAAAVYTELVVRGERVVRNVRTEASLEIAPADGTVTTSTSHSTTAKPAAKATKSPAKKSTTAQR